MTCEDVTPLSEEDRPLCDRCGEFIVAPALIRAGKTKPEWLCGTCRDQ